MGEETYCRPSWDEYFLGLMEEVGNRATCDRGRSGCIVVRDKQIVCTGYVGSPPGFPHCDEAGPVCGVVCHGNFLCILIFQLKSIFLRLPRKAPPGQISCIYFFVNLLNSQSGSCIEGYCSEY